MTVANIEINVAKFPNVTLSCNNLKPNLKTPYPWPVSSLMINTNQFDFRPYDAFFAFLRHDFKRKAWNVLNKMYFFFWYSDRYDIHFIISYRRLIMFMYWLPLSQAVLDHGKKRFLKTLTEKGNIFFCGYLIFSCLGQLDRWPCHSLTHLLIYIYIFI